MSYLYHQLSESFWCLPSLIAIAAIALSVGTLALDRNPPLSFYELLPWSEGLDRSNARLIMSTISGSIITAASLVFSLTLVSLTLAAGQLGPRLLSIFMRDRITQVAIGTFVGTFIFALLVLANLGETEGALEVPRASIFVALVLTLLSFGLLIAFVHHQARSLNADVVVARLAQNLDAQLSALLGDPEDQCSSVSREFEGKWTQSKDVLSNASGYVQTIDCKALVEIAIGHDTEILLHYRAGHFVHEGEAIARIRGEPEKFRQLADDVCGSIVLGPKRTDAEDPEHAFQAIAEIALRALSPGINDPYTALTCIDWLGDALTKVLTGRMPESTFQDEDGAIRLHTDPLCVEGFFDVALNEIRQAAEGKAPVLIRLAEMLVRLGKVANTASKRGIIQRHADMIERTCERSITEGNDREDFQRRLREVKLALSS
ncbi:MAG: DUF2254 domain-containing protein [Kiloniellales bacterium]|nr:DUF2254 domain-containing protein [Kiloniellales bacterium]